MAPLFFRVLLLAYPPSLRRDYGLEMRRAVAEHWHMQRSLGSRVRFLAHLVGDFLTSWPRAWRGGRSRGPQRRWTATDLRDAARLFRRSPAFALGAVLTLALGIGASTAILSLADATILRPLPIPRADRLVQTTFSWSHPDFRDAVTEQTAFTTMAAWSNLTFGIEQPSGTLQVNGLGVSGRFFETTGQRPVAGRLITDADDRPGAPLAVVLSERLWAREFNRDASIVGRELTINRQPVTVVGVAPAAFRGLSLQFTPELFVAVINLPQLSTGFLADPAAMTNRGRVWLNLVGRLKDDATISQADEQLRQIYYRRRPAATEQDRSVWLTPVLGRAYGVNTAADLRRFVIILVAATGVTLLLTCATVANLLLVRAERRRHEFAVRAALGAGRTRLSRLLLVESLGIGLAGGLAGAIVASLTLRLLGTFALPGQILISDLQLSVDPALVAAAALLGLVTAVIFGMAPIWQTSRLQFAAALRGGARATTRQPVRSVLIGIQVGLCVLLLGGSLAFGRALQHALSLDLGFSITDTTITAINPSLLRYPASREARLRQDILDALRAQPRFRAAAWALLRPLSGAFVVETVIDGYVPPGGKLPTIQSNIVTDGYFEAMGIPTLAGRSFAATDAAGSARVAVVSQSLAAKYWPAGNAIGKRLSMEDPGAADPKWITVVGVAGDIHRTIGGPAVPMIYTPMSQAPASFTGNYLIVRGTGAPEDTVRDVRATLRQIDANVPITNAGPMRVHVNGPLMAHRLGLTLFMLFAGLSVVLTGLGLYAVVAAAISQRTREIGIRVALGARGAEVLRMVLRQGALPIVAGLAAGLAAAAAASRLIAGFMFSLPALTPVSVAVLIAAIGVVSFLAMLLPAKRALAVSPTVTLKD
jgi:predicted permease